MARETFLQVLQICKGKAPGRMKDEQQAVFCLAGFWVFYAVFSDWAQDLTGPSNWWVLLDNGGQVLMLKVKRETIPHNLHPQVFSLGRWVHIFIDISYLVPFSPSPRLPTPFAFFLVWPRPGERILCFSPFSPVQPR